MGTVFKAYHLNLKRFVAIKTLKIDQHHSPEVIRRFKQEMELVGQMDHPNVVRATDAGERNGIFFLVMEHLPGTDLSRLVHKRGRLDPTFACEIIRQAALGLDYIHEKGLVHRDIKPSNLMLTQDRVVKILDLGLARFGLHEHDNQELTPAGYAVGTYSYMAPEQATTGAAIDARADLYSLGCTLFRLLTGHAPYSGSEYDSPAKVLYAHCHVPLESTPDFEFVPSELRDVLLRMTSKDPAHRFRTGREVAEALAPFVGESAMTPLPSGSKSGDEIVETPVRPLTDPWPEELSRLTGSPQETPRDSVGDTHSSPATISAPAPVPTNAEWPRWPIVAAMSVIALVHRLRSIDGSKTVRLPGVRNCKTCDDFLSREPFMPDSARMRHKADAFLASIPECPADRFHGRGIVIAGGGEKFLASLYVTIRAIRHVGCLLPIQVWYLGRNDEMPSVWQALQAAFDVECIDADEVRSEFPAQKLNGWELKVFATLHCPFEEVLFLDADCYPCRNPDFLLDVADYVEHGAIFWPDMATVDTRLKWPAFGVVDPKRPGSVESGQFVINKKKCWTPLNLTWFYNDHSDYYYRYCYGDKHTFEVAWARCEQPFVMWTPRAVWDKVAYVHAGPDGEPLFVHRCADKFRFEWHDYVTNQNYPGVTFQPTLPMEHECWNWLDDLAGILGREPPRSPAQRRPKCELWKYERRVYSQNGEDGIIGEIFRRTGTTGLAVELGSHFEYGNCYLLAEQGMPTLFIDRDPDFVSRLARRIHGPHVSYKIGLVTAETVNSAVPSETVFLSIDVDGNDYWLWRALEWRPEVIVIEFNHGPQPPHKLAIAYDPQHSWDGSDYYGASLSALDELARHKGYVLVAIDSVQCNAYFVLERYADRFERVTPESVWFPPTWSHPRSSRTMIVPPPP